jgi:hypothetical protein
VKGWLSAGLLFAVAASAPAQVGYTPEKSPYRDLVFSREWTAFTGAYNAKPDPAGVAPRDGTMFGVRYDARVGGPAYVGARIATAVVDRVIIDPSKPIAERRVGTERVPLLFTDILLSVNITGYRTWHGIIPVINGGLGITGDLRGKNDLGDYRFGMPFTMTFGGGIKWVSNGSWQLRADWGNYIYQIRYPESYYLRTGEDNPVRLPGQPRSMWRRNTALTIGVSRLYHR